MPDIKQARFVAIVVNLITRALTRVPRASSVLLVLVLALLAGACSSSPVVYRDAHVGIISTPESIHTDKQIAFDLDIDLAVTSIHPSGSLPAVEALKMQAEIAEVVARYTQEPTP